MKRSVIGNRHGLIRLLDTQVVQRGGGDSILLGRCGMCGRKLGRSKLNKVGVRCYYEGAQYDAAGYLVNRPWEQD